MQNDDGLDLHDACPSGRSWYACPGAKVRGAAPVTCLRRARPQRPARLGPRRVKRVALLGVMIWLI